MEQNRIKEILSHVDHTLLAVDAGWDAYRTVIDDGIRYHTASVCIPANRVAEAAAYAQGRVPICTVIGFPNGYSTTEAKCFEAADALRRGADEIDMVIAVGVLKDGRYDDVLADIGSVREAMDAVSPDRVLKVIVETCLLTEEEKVRMCGIVGESGADYIKTSTGFSKGGATFEDIALFAAHVRSGLKIKAAGGISSLEDAEKFLALGADRLGTSRIVRIVKEAGLL